MAAGDFNGHFQKWGYIHLDQRDLEIKAWQDEHTNSNQDSQWLHSTPEDDSQHQLQTLISPPHIYPD